MPLFAIIAFDAPGSAVKRIDYLKPHIEALAELQLAVTYILFNLYGTVGRHGYGSISEFISLLSVWLIPPIMICCWPWRAWVREKLKCIMRSQ